MPYLEQAGLYNAYQFEKPWDAPENKEVAEAILPIFQSPRLTPAGQNTNFVVVVGEDTGFPPTNEEGGWRDGTRRSDFRDGTSYTILVIEIANSDIHWAEPRDVTIDDLQRVSEGADPRATNVVPRQVLVGLADGSVHLLGPEITPKLWANLLNRHDGQVIDWPQRR